MASFHLVDFFCSNLLKFLVMEQNSVKLKNKYPILKKEKKKCILIKTSNWDLKFIVVICHVNGPGKLLTLGFVVDLLNRNTPLLTPTTVSDKMDSFSVAVLSTHAWN